MRHCNNLHSIILALTAMALFLILISSTALASIIETRITNHGTAENPTIYDNTIVWQDNRNAKWDIYTYDLSTNKETQITKSGSVDNAVKPVIYGNRIVWMDKRNGGSVDNQWGGEDVYMYDLSTKKEIRITKSTMPISPDYSFSLDIYGNKILWSIDGAFCIYDISTHKENWVNTSTSSFYHAFYGKIVAWIYEMNAAEGGNLYMYDLSAYKEIPVVTSSSAGSPEVYGNKIVYEDRRNTDQWGIGDIYVYDVTTHKEAQITINGTAEYTTPGIYGNIIVWADHRSGKDNIYAYDLKTHQQINTKDNSDQSSPAIYGNKVVWIDYRSGKPDVYMGTISFLPFAAFTAAPISGTHPLNVQFTDKSSDAYYWSWDFGDKKTSTLPSPKHQYKKAGKYTVILTVKNAAGKNTVIKTNYITVK
jgi:beta propeller repeat protein